MTLQTAAPARRRRPHLQFPRPHGRPTTPTRGHSDRVGDERGQATSEYGLVILAAGGIALGVIAWAGKTGVFTELFESVVDSLTSGL